MLLALVPVVLALELLNPDGGVHELHFAGEKGMASRANLDVLFTTAIDSLFGIESKFTEAYIPSATKVNLHPKYFPDDRRRWTDADFESFAAMNADPRVMEFFPNLMSRTDSAASFERIQKHFADYGYSLWVADVGDEFADGLGLGRQLRGGHGHRRAGSRRTGTEG